MSNFSVAQKTPVNQSRKTFKLQTLKVNLADQNLIPLQVQQLSTIEKIKSVYSLLKSRNGVLNGGDFDKMNISELRSHSIQKANWNFFVGDQNFKTDFFLRFYGTNVGKDYQHFMLASNKYSIRVLLLTLALINFVLANSIQIEESSDIQTKTFSEAITSYWVIFLSLFMGLFGQFAMSLTVLQRQFFINIGTILPTVYIMLINKFEPHTNIVTNLLILSSLLPGLILHQFILSSWIKYLSFLTFNFAISIFLTHYQSEAELLSTLRQIGFLTALLILVFACMEKVNKEHFVLINTNTRARKKLLIMVDQNYFAQAIVKKNGQILFYNEKFKVMCLNKPPENIFQLLKEDQRSTEKLMRLIAAQQESRPTKDQSNNLEFENVNYTDIQIRKSLDTVEVTTQSNSKKFFSNFEIFTVSASYIVFTNQKSILLCFTSITEHKAQIQMMSIHNKQLTNFVEKFKDQVESNLQDQHELSKPSDTGSIQDALTQTLGNSNLMLSNLQLMQHQLNFMASRSSLENVPFHLEDQVKYCFEGLSVNLNVQTTFKLHHDDRLPNLFQGDLASLKLALVTLIEFGMKYQHSGQIELKTYFDGLDVRDRNITRICFRLTLFDNESQKSKIIFQLLNNSNKKANFDSQSDLVKRFITFYDLIDEFGLGMVIFPDIVQKMGGFTSAKYLAAENNTQRLGDAIFTLNNSNQLNGKPETFIISFTVPLQKVDSETKIKSPNLQINKTKETKGQQSTWKSPLIAKNDRKLKQMNSAIVVKNPSNNKAALNDVEKAPIMKGGQRQQITSKVNLTQKNGSEATHAEDNQYCGLKQDDLYFGSQQKEQISSPKYDKLSHLKNQAPADVYLSQVGNSFSVRETEQVKAAGTGDSNNNRRKQSLSPNVIPFIPQQSQQQRGISEEPKQNNKLNNRNSNHYYSFIQQSEDGFGPSQVNVPASSKEFLSSFRQNYQMQVQQSQRSVEQSQPVNSSEANKSFSSDSFAGLENFGSFMVSENLDPNLRIKQCEVKENEDADQRKARLQSVTNQEIKQQLAGFELKAQLEKHTKSQKINLELANEIPEILSQVMTNGASRQIMRSPLIQSKNSLSNPKVKINQDLLTEQSSSEGANVIPSYSSLGRSSHQFQRRNESIEQQQIIYPNFCSPNPGQIENQVKTNQDPFYEHLKISGLRHGLIRLMAQDCEKHIDSAKLQDALIEEDEKELTKVINWAPQQQAKNQNSQRIVFSSLSQLLQGKQNQNRISLFDRQGKQLSFTIQQKFALQKKLKVLIVEDNSLSMQTFQQILRNLDVNYEMTTCAEESVAMFKDTLNEGLLYDCIFMKLIIPGMSGFEAAQEFRKIETQFGLNSEVAHFICGITAEISDQLLRKCEENGIDDLVQKPIDINQIDKLLKINNKTLLKSQILAQLYNNECRVPESVTLLDL